MDRSPATILTAFAALIFVLGLIWLAGRALRLARSATGAPAGRRLSVTDSLALSPRRRLVLVRCDGRDLLLITGGTQDVLLGWLPPPEAGR